MYNLSMKIFNKAMFSLLLIILNSSVNAQVDKNDSWKRYESDDAVFSMLMPSEPEYLIKDIMTSIGSMELHSYMFAPDTGDQDQNLMYLLEYYDYPDGTFPEDSLELKSFFYDQTALATSIDIGGELVYKTNSSVDGIKGMLYRCQYKDDTYIMKSRMFFVGDRFYHIKVYCLKAHSLNDDMDAFLDSFKIN